MKHLLLSQEEAAVQQRLVFYLALEEYLAACFPAKGEEWFFLWQSRPTVIFGRNQDMAAEVNIPWCESHGVEMYRRKSGGGCVYSDEGNLMVSCIVREHDAQKAFQTYLERLAGALRTLGLPAVTTVHNDILVNGLKVSGNACFVGRNATILHGTMLWKSNMDNLTQAITPSQEKLAKHAVQSVRQRVGNLYDMGIRDLEVLKKHLISSMCDGEYTLAAEEMSAIRAIELGYLDPKFIQGKG